MKGSLIFTLVFTSCISLGDKTRLDSDDYSTPQERVEALKEVLNEPTSFSDAEFELFNVNGFSSSRSTPGASSWDYKFAVRIKPNQFDKWVFNRDTITDPNWDLSWMYEIIQQRKSNWKLLGNFSCFGSSEDQLIFFPKSNVLFRRSIAN